MERVSDEERERIAELLTDGSARRFLQEITRSRRAIRLAPLTSTWATGASLSPESERTTPRYPALEHASVDPYGVARKLRRQHR